MLKDNKIESNQISLVFNEINNFIQTLNECPLIENIIKLKLIQFHQLIKAMHPFVSAQIVTHQMFLLIRLLLQQDMTLSWEQNLLKPVSLEIQK